MTESAESFHESLAALVDGWCERRCLPALRHILRGYPLSSGLTDDWANLLNALEEVRALAGDELTNEEMQIVGDLIGQVSRVIYRT